ncbi:MAG: hypothetical protein IJS32_04295 [Kiritimatiellae bacterium]|nr:hypothetical protein [Kiritimatiellia bacterium]
MSLTRFGDGGSDGSRRVVRHRKDFRFSTSRPLRLRSAPSRFRPMGTPASASSGRMAASTFFVPARGLTARSCRTSASTRSSRFSRRLRSFRAL